MPGISPTILFVSGSISIKLSPAELVWTIRTVAAWSAVEAARSASAREHLVFIATHFKLPGHGADPLFEPPRAGGLDARLRRVQGENPAAPDGKASGPRALHHVPLDRHEFSPHPAPEGTHRLHRGGV